jgi:hypothetical protein
MTDTRAIVGDGISVGFLRLHVPGLAAKRGMGNAGRQRSREGLLQLLLQHILRSLQEFGNQLAPQP